MCIKSVLLQFSILHLVIFFLEKKQSNFVVLVDLWQLSCMLLYLWLMECYFSQED